PALQDHLAGGLVDDVELAADRHAGVTGRGGSAAAGDRVVADRAGIEAAGRGVLTRRHRPAAEGRGPGPDRAAGRADRRAEVALGHGVGAGRHRILAGYEGLAVAAGLEVAVGVLRHLGHGLELVEVHGIRALGTGRHVGDLALHAGVADGHGVVAVRVGVRAERDAVGGRSEGVRTQRDGVASARVAVVADGGAEHPGGPGAVAEGRAAFAA